MEHANYFRTFLRDSVNIDDSRLELLAGRVDAVYNALCDDETIGGLITGKSRQGSWAQQLIVRPRPDTEFNADFLLEMDHQPDWEPKQYLNEVYNALHRHSIYSKQAHGRKCRCVWLRYAPKDNVGCHLDIVPLVTLPGGRRVIVNRDDDTWEPGCGSTDPSGFTDWVTQRNGYASGEFLRVVRLLKYLKRERGSFDGVKSVILTTVLGNQLTMLDASDMAGFHNTPTAMLTIVERLDKWLDANEDKPPLPNPSGDGTYFDHRWTQETYANFRTRIHSIAADMRDAHDEEDQAKSATKWQALFGDAFTPPTPQPQNNGNPLRAAAAAAVTSSRSRSGRAG